jgi:hypothetical protein
MSPENPKVRYKRRIKLIKPGLQLKITAMFMGVSATSLLLQYLLFSSQLANVATTLPDGGAVLLGLMPDLLIQVLFMSFAFLFPVMLCVGILSTFRIAGPVYRFERYLESVARGEEVGPCRIRRGDELWELCDKINEATAALRHRKDAAGAEAEEAQKDTQELRRAG